MRTISIVGTDIHGPEDWWDTHHPEENPWLDGGRLRFDRAHDPSMHNQYYELAVLAEIDGMAIGLRGNRDPGFEHIPLFSRIIQDFFHDFEGRPTPTLMPFIDTVGLGDLANYDDPDAEPKQKFDFANDAHLERFWTDFLGPFYVMFPEGQGQNPISWERTPNDRPLILFWGINADTGHGIVNQVYAARLLDRITEKMQGHGYGTPDFIVDHTWIQHVPALDVYGVHAWFYPERNEPYSITRRGSTVGLTVPGYIDPPGSSSTRRIDRRDGDTLRDALTVMRWVRADYVFIESFNNRTESAGLYRTDAWWTRELDTVREHIHSVRTERTEIL